MPRSLQRGLQVLLLLNARESASVAEIRDETGAPRASLYRVLDTLVREGFVFRHPSDNRFRLAKRVRALSAGFSEHVFLMTLAQPSLDAVTAELRWPVSLGMLSGAEVEIRGSTDEQSPMAADRFALGYRMPVLTTATGLCLLAHLERSEREALLAELASTGQATALRDRAALDTELRTIRSRGFAVFERRRQRTSATSIAVPIKEGRGPLRGAITLRYAKAALPLSSAVSRFVPVLRRAAHEIAQRAEET